MFIAPQELKATNEALRALQLQLEKAYHTSNLTQPVPAPPNSTLTAILETKDARIATLEKEVALLEQELDRIRECGVLGPARAVLLASPTLDLDYPTSYPSYPKLEINFKRQVSAPCSRGSGHGIAMLSVGGGEVPECVRPGRVGCCGPRHSGPKC